MENTQLDIPHFGRYIPNELRLELLKDVAVTRGGVGLLQYSHDEVASHIDKVCLGVWVRDCPHERTIFHTDIETV